LGFNITDNYLWAYRIGTNQIVRIASDWSTEIFSIPGLPANIGFNIGDVNSDGIMHLFSSIGGSNSTIYRVDINPSSPTYLQLLPSLGTSPSSISECAFCPIDNNLYAIHDYDFRLFRYVSTTRT